MSQLERPPLRHAFRALGVRNYRLFWCGHLTSQTGSWLQTTAQAWVVLSLTGSSFALGTVAAIQFTPILLLTLFGGVVADRLPKRRVLLTAQTIMLGQAVVMAALAATDSLQLVHLYLLAAVLGTANALDAPTRQSFVSELVGPENLSNAVALNSTLFNTARLVGPSLAGVLIAWLGPAACFGLNALSYLAMITMLSLIRLDHTQAPRRADRGGSLLSQVGEGLRFVVSTPDAALVALLVAVLGLFGYNFQTVLPLIARFVLDAGPIGFGVLTSALGVGSLISALSVAYRSQATQRSLLGGAAAFSVLLLCLSLSRWWAVSIPLLIVIGIANIVFSATANTRLQLVTPPQLRGRVMSIYALLFMGTTPIGSLIIGTLAERQGIQVALGETATICCLGVVGAYLYAHRMRAHMTPGTPAPLLAVGERESRRAQA
ncbi:MAG: MFS transporter [Chloroflexi bacterium]|nr:MFS transporter [Chloroflexota bacterium]